MADEPEDVVPAEDAIANPPVDTAVPQPKTVPQDQVDPFQPLPIGTIVDMSRGGGKAN